MIFGIRRQYFCIGWTENREHSISQVSARLLRKPVWVLDQFLEGFRSLRILGTKRTDF
jgi:hypothetical protein